MQRKTDTVASAFFFCFEVYDRAIERLRKRRAEMFANDDGYDHKKSQELLEKIFALEDEKADFAQNNSFADGDPKITAMLMNNDVQQKSKAVEEILSRAGLPESTWSGVTLEKPVDDPEMVDAAGMFQSRRKDIWIRADYKHDLSTIVHEHLHARSFGRADVKTDPKIEEGSVQYLTEEILIDKGVAPHKAYTKYVDAIRIIRTVIAPRQTDYEFAKKLFDIPLGSRYNELKGMCDDYVSKHPKMRQKVREEISKSIETLKGDVEDDES